jgi:hypothetical protein
MRKLTLNRRARLASIGPRFDDLPAQLVAGNVQNHPSSDGLAVPVLVNGRSPGPKDAIPPEEGAVKGPAGPRWRACVLPPCP